MKRVLSMMLLAGIFLTFSSAKAQNIKVGGGLVYSTNISNLGVSVNGAYKFNDKIDIAPSFIYYFTKDYVSWKELNFDGHYKFMKKKGMDIYALAGLAITMVSVDLPDWGFGYNASYSESDIGVNVGVGAIKDFGKFDLFGEAKYTLGSADHTSISAGVLYKF